MASTINGIPCEIENGPLKDSLQQVTSHIRKNFSDDWSRIEGKVKLVEYYVENAVPSDERLRVDRNYEHYESMSKLCVPYVAFELAILAVTQEDVELRMGCEDAEIALELATASYVYKWGFSKPYNELIDFFGKHNRQHINSHALDMQKPGINVSTWIPLSNSVYDTLEDVGINPANLLLSKAWRITEQFMPEFNSVIITCDDADAAVQEDGRVFVKLHSRRGDLAIAE